MLLNQAPISNATIVRDSDQEVIGTYVLATGVTMADRDRVFLPYEILKRLQRQVDL